MTDRTTKEVAEATKRAKRERVTKVGKPGNATTGGALGAEQRSAGLGSRGGFAVPADMPPCHEDAD
jgi:hypothetical protein